MELRRIEIGKLNAAEYNPRIMLEPGDPEFEKLANSIRYFGNVEPIVWNETTGNVVGGHQRLNVLKHLGETETTVSVVHLDEKDEKVLNVALNKIKGAWDNSKLEEILKSFDPSDVSLSGFDAQEIALMLATNEDIDANFNFVDEDTEVFEPEPGTSFIVSLVFKSTELAQEWATAHGYKKQVKDGKKTTVIRIE